MGHEYKVGDRVRRTVQTQAELPAGATGTVTYVGYEHLVADFDNGQKHVACFFDRIEPLDAPAAELLQCGVIAMSAQQARQLEQQQMANAVYQQAAQQQGQGGLGQRAAPWPCTNHVTHERAKELCEKAVANATVGLRSELADVKGERHALWAKVAELETDAAFYRRECVRLGGKARRS
jgi:hypothetical protein